MAKRYRSDTDPDTAGLTSLRFIHLQRSGLIEMIKTKNKTIFKNFNVYSQITGRYSKHSSDTASSTLTISTDGMEKIIDKLRCQNHRSSTKMNYHCIWKKFNEFFIRLDRKPNSWEDQIILFVGFLIEEKKKSTTIRSYVSAIKTVLLQDGIRLNQDQYLLSSLTKACKLKNDQVRIRLPLQKGIVNLILDQVDNYYNNKGQVFLQLLYKALFSSAYYGMLRVSELTHPIKALEFMLERIKAKSCTSSDCQKLMVQMPNHNL